MKTTTKFQSTLRLFINDCSGTTSIEYAIIGSTASIVFVAAAVSIGDSVSGFFDNVAGKF